MGHLLGEAAEAIHVAGSGGVLDGACSKEEAAFEEAVIEAVEQAGGDGERRADADSHHHVADLANGGEGEHALEIGLDHGVHDADGHGDDADPDEGCAPSKGPCAEAVHAGGEIDAGGYVAGGVEQGADRGGRGHGLGNPGVKRNLDAFGDEGHEHQEKDAAGKGVGDGRIGPERGTGAVIDDQDGGEETVSGDVGHEQDFACAVDRFAVGVPEADEREGAEADQFPAEIEEEEVGAEDQADEAADEDEHDGVEARGGAVVGHVPDGIEEDEESDGGAHEGKQDAERIDMEDQGQGAVPGQGLEFDGLPEAHPGNEADDGEDGGDAGEKGQDSLGSSGTKPRHENLQRCAQQKRARSDEDEGRGCHVSMLSAMGLGVM